MGKTRRRVALGCAGTAGLLAVEHSKDCRDSVKSFRAGTVGSVSSGRESSCKRSEIGRFVFKSSLAARGCGPLFAAYLWLSRSCYLRGQSVAIRLTRSSVPASYIGEAIRKAADLI